MPIHRHIRTTFKPCIPPHSCTRHPHPQMQSMQPRHIVHELYYLHTSLSFSISIHKSSFVRPRASELFGAFWGFLELFWGFRAPRKHGKTLCFRNFRELSGSFQGLSGALELENAAQACVFACREPRKHENTRCFRNRASRKHVKTRCLRGGRWSTGVFACREPRKHEKTNQKYGVFERSKKC